MCGLDSDKPLPLPRPAADKLKTLSILTIKEWVEQYGCGYPKLKIGYNFLKHNKKVCNLATKTQPLAINTNFGKINIRFNLRLL